MFDVFFSSQPCGNSHKPLYSRRITAWKKKEKKMGKLSIVAY